VPFGKRAYPESEQRPEDPELGELPLAPPAGPDAFWGEESAQIHAVVPAPETGERLGGLPTRRRGTDKPIARDVAHGSTASHGHFRTDAWLRSRAIRPAAGLLVAAACAAVALGRLGAAPAVDTNQPGATGGGGPAAGVISDGRASGRVALALLQSNAQHRVAPAKRTAGGANRRRPHAVVHRRVRSPKPVAHPTAVSVDTAPASSAPAATTAPDATSKPFTPTASSTGSSSPPAMSVAESPSSASTATHTASTTRSSSHHPNSSTRPAFGALGTVAPGSSPDG
jgi:hypothetical protein